MGLVAWTDGNRERPWPLAKNVQLPGNCRRSVRCATKAVFPAPLLRVTRCLFVPLLAGMRSAWGACFFFKISAPQAVHPFSSGRSESPVTPCPFARFVNGTGVYNWDWYELLHSLTHWCPRGAWSCGVGPRGPLYPESLQSCWDVCCNQRCVRVLASCRVVFTCRRCGWWAPHQPPGERLGGGGTD